MRCKIAVAGVAAPGRVATSSQARIHLSVDVRDKSRYKTQHANVDKSDLDLKANDATTMDQILADDFVLVTGSSVFSKADLLDSARKKEATYERQDEEPGTQKVRVWSDTAVVTALLWIKSVQGSKSADYKLWFSDTYVRTPTGWRYVFGQASLPLPRAESK